MSSFIWKKGGVLQGLVEGVSLPQILDLTDGDYIEVAAVGAFVGALAITAKTFSEDATAGTVIGNLLGVKTGDSATFTPTNEGDAGKITTSGTGANAKLIVGLTASAIGSILGVISAPGVASLPITLTVSTAQVIPNPVINLDFTGGTLPSDVVFSRAASATTGPYYLDTTTTGFSTVGNDTPRFRENAVIIEEDRRQWFPTPTAPAPCTIDLSPEGYFEGYEYYCLWMMGSGSITISANGAVGTGFGTATQGHLIIIRLTQRGTVDITMTGEVLICQLEGGPGPSMFMPNPGSRGPDQVVRHFDGLWNYHEGTVSFRLKIFSGGRLGTNNHIDGINANNGGTTCAAFHSNNITTPMTLVADNGVIGANLTYSHGLTFNEWHTIASSWGPAGQQLSLDGLPTETSGAGGAADPNFTTTALVLLLQNATKEGGSALVKYWKLWDEQIAGDDLSYLSALNGPVAPVSFVSNGSTNPATRAMLSRGYGVIVEKGDSTTVGAGAALQDGTVNGDATAQLAGARSYRVSATMAAKLTSLGHPARDGGFVGDGANAGQGVSLSVYDPRVIFTAGVWPTGGGETFSGGNYLMPFQAAGSRLDFTESDADTFRVVLYNTGGGLDVTLDGVPATDITLVGINGSVVGSSLFAAPESVSGFSVFLVKASSVGTHVLGLQQTPSGGNAVFRSAHAYKRGAPGIQVINHAGNGATSDQQATGGGNNWLNQEALALDAPDLTIIRLGLNDNGGTSAYVASLTAIINKARLTGDVLIVNPNAANPNFRSYATQNEYRAAAKALAVSMNVAWCDVRERFGDYDVTGVRMADDLVHPNRQFYAAIGQFQAEVILSM